MAIHNRSQLENTQRKIASLELALDEMKKEEPAEAYTVFSEGFVAQIINMRREIDEYLEIAQGFVEEPVALLK